ncbi:hypothetical protein NEOLEDRAFT_1129890 [Neolentinus lepideus HHB14362 ss-1]|uniref:Uncharacterized protein n=1 Tax=Neolentinus lepideus HHB14362 ss-1 TaxID=1314782 RepID=A0A165UDL6_9AGAM|nr:hypothetical protein NEOLEDRAFT_1129890 [Neolentinus lepideus HHB14362 ss-1]
MTIFLAMWCLLVAGLLSALPMFYLRVQNLSAGKPEDTGTPNIGIEETDAKEKGVDSVVVCPA